MFSKKELSYRVMALDTCVVALMVERFRAASDPLAALDAFDTGLQEALQISMAGVVERMRAKAPEQPAEQIEHVVQEEMEPIDTFCVELLAKVRQLLLQQD